MKSGCDVERCPTGKKNNLSSVSSTSQSFILLRTADLVYDCAVLELILTCISVHMGLGSV